MFDRLLFLSFSCTQFLAQQGQFSLTCFIHSFVFLPLCWYRIELLEAKSGNTVLPESSEYQTDLQKSFTLRDRDSALPCEISPVLYEWTCRVTLDI